MAAACWAVPETVCQVNAPLPTKVVAVTVPAKVGLPLSSATFAESRVSLTVPEVIFAASRLGIWPDVKVPLTLAAGTGPVTLAAVWAFTACTAWGAEVTGWRGVSTA